MATQDGDEGSGATARAAAPSGGAGASDHDAVARTAVRERLARLFADFGGEHAIQFEGSWVTWDRIGRLADAVGAATGADAGRVDGLAAGAGIAVLLRQRPALLALELATLALGRPVIALTPVQADAALAADVRATAPPVVVAHRDDWARPGLADAVAEAGAMGLAVGDDLELTVAVAAPGALPPGPLLDAAVTVLTSGTTGPPKRLPVPWSTFVAVGGGPEGRPARSDKGALILSLPLATLGGFASLARLVFGGRPLAMMERFDVHAWVALVKEHRPATIGAPPPVVKMILDAGISPDHFDGVTAYVTGSAPVPVAVKEAFEQRYGIPVLVGYGATEFLGAVTGWTPELWAAYGNKAASAGRPTAGARLRVIDPTSAGDPEPREQPPGVEGILEVDPPRRAGHLPPGWLRTADRAVIDEDGFVWIRGRVDDVILRGGFKVDLTAVETALGEHPAVAEACVVGLPDERLGEVPGALVVRRVDVDVVPAAQLQQWVRDRLAPYAVPVLIEWCDELPRTSTLKPHRALVAERLAERLAELRSAGR